MASICLGLNVLKKRGHRKQCEDQLRVNTLRPRQNGSHFADDTFKHIFLNENVRISSQISLEFVTKGPINNIPALVQIMAWRRPGNKPLSEPMMVCLLTHICVTRPQWVKGILQFNPSHAVLNFIKIHLHVISFFNIVMGEVFEMLLQRRQDPFFLHKEITLAISLS